MRSSWVFSVHDFNCVTWGAAFLPHLWISTYPVHLDAGDVALKCWPYQPSGQFTLSYLHHLDSVLVTYCYVTDDHTMRVLRQHPFTSSEGQECGELSCVLCSWDHKSTVKVQLDWPFMWRLKIKIYFQGHSCWWWTQFFLVVELKTPFSWLSAKNYSQLLEVTHIPFQVAPSAFKLQWCMESFSCFDSL